MSLDVGFIDNIPNNAYNKTMKKYLELQAPNPIMVNGRMENYIPDHEYIGVTRGGKLGKKKPSKQWAPYESKFRKPVTLTSTAFEKLTYSPMAKVLHYKFRNGDVTYTRPMVRDLWNMFATSSSLGKFYNRFLK